MSSSNPSFFLYTWIMAPMGTSSSYAHLKFQVPIPSLITLGFWLQWTSSNFFKLYTLEAFSLRHNETLSSFQDLSNTTQALMNTKVHSKICKCNECTLIGIKRGVYICTHMCASARVASGNIMTSEYYSHGELGY